MTSVHSPKFGIDDIQSMMRNLYIDRLSISGNTNKITGRGTAMVTTRKPRKVRCYNCQEFGHFQRDCTNHKRERSTTSKWCSLHNSTTHSGAEGKAPKGRENANTNTLPQDEVTNTPPQGEVHSAHTMTGPTPMEGKYFGYAFTIAPPASQRDPNPSPRPQSVFTRRHMDEPTTLLTVSADHIRRRLGAVSPRL